MKNSIGKPYEGNKIHELQINNYICDLLILPDMTPAHKELFSRNNLNDKVFMITS